MITNERERIEQCSQSYIALTARGGRFFLNARHDTTDEIFLHELIALSTMPQTAQWVRDLEYRHEKPLSEISRLLDKGYIEQRPCPEIIDLQSLQQQLPSILDDLSITGNVALADEAGFLLASNGFELETAEQISAMAAELLTLQKRRANLIAQFSHGEPLVMSFADERGRTRIGFWPLYMADRVFVLVLQGKPRFSNDAIAKLLLFLGQRFL